jgi:host factor-I protein
MDNSALNSQNVQDAFLNNLRKDRINITIYLMGGVKLTGKIRSFDKFSVVLESGNLEQLVFIMPGTNRRTSRRVRRRLPRPAVEQGQPPLPVLLRVVGPVKRPSPSLPGSSCQSVKLQVDCLRPPEAFLFLALPGWSWAGLCKDGKRVARLAEGIRG